MINREEHDTRQARRAGKLRKKREQMKRHGGSLSRIYRNAVMKRLKNRAIRKRHR